MKYVWSASGLCIIAIPALQAKASAAAAPAGDALATADAKPAGGGGSRTEEFVTARNLLVNAADAIERIMSSWKEVTELAGYTARVDEMLTVFDEVKAGKCVRKGVSSSGATGSDGKPTKGRQQRTGVLTEEQAKAAAAGGGEDEKKADSAGKRDLFKEREESGARQNMDHLTRRGVTIEDPNLIEAINVPITTPVCPWARVCVCIGCCPNLSVSLIFRLVSILCRRVMYWWNRFRSL